MIDRARAIQIIDALYPIDSQYEATTAVGRELLARAKREVGEPYDWRDESDAVLSRYAELCEQHEIDEERALRRRLAR